MRCKVSQQRKYMERVSLQCPAWARDAASPLLPAPCCSEFEVFSRRLPVDGPFFTLNRQRNKGACLGNPADGKL